MSYYDDIYEIAVDNYYLISTEDATEAGIPPVELAKLAHRGKLENISRGLYRLTRYVPSDYDPYAIAVARLGSRAYLYGESVIGMLDLAPTDPSRIFVATPARTRRKLSPGIRVKKPGKKDVVTRYEGIPSQNVATAIRAARQTMMDERLLAAAKEAKAKGYLTTQEYEELKREMEWR
ncbi:type IV toxin-antitoxin system AbiEi family antitoxin domain-containing protein [Adlercreutzia sp. ZJ154]|uniref:type IV toxin-antitoxin system AbiEi family antitoxin domain-containing protein n=1 Tax=Adlercreutzia sp. ZJ154 TaxID=2709790 RepID=UPI0013ED1D31|nr:type IV toxin-antitoxin system AbiEi family antitoxin domain-containing protein [Adlercreutzia sp. ZJ154]